MAVENYLTNYGTTPGVGEKLEPGRGATEVVRYNGYATVAAADDDGSTYLLAKAVPSSFVPTEFRVSCDAITGGTDYDIGLYNSVTGVVVDKDLLADGITLATAVSGPTALDGLVTVDLADLGALKSLAELLSLTPSTAKATYDIVLTANTVGSAAGDVRVVMDGLAG